MISESLILSTLFDLLLGGIIAMGWGILFNVPRNVLYVVGLLGGLGHSLRYFLLTGFDVPLVIATLSGTVAVGFLGILFARKEDMPPVVFTMPACITMIPGLYAYNTMLGFVKMARLDVSAIESDLVTRTAHSFVITISLLFCLSIGITIGSLLFRKKTAREIFKRHPNM
jgi:Uncharacterized conserved protein